MSQGESVPSTTRPAAIDGRSASAPARAVSPLPNASHPLVVWREDAPQQQLQEDACHEREQGYGGRSVHCPPDHDRPRPPAIAGKIATLSSGRRRALMPPWCRESWPLMTTSTIVPRSSWSRTQRRKAGP